MPAPVTHLWRPAAARYLALDGFVPVPRGTAPATPAPLSWPVKDPGDVLDYQFDITAAVVGDETDSISGLDVVISPANAGDLTLVSAAALGNAVVLWLSAGIAGTEYVVTLSIATAGGRVLVRDVLLPVLSLSTPPAPGTTLLAAPGQPIITQTGQTLTVA